MRVLGQTHQVELRLLGAHQAQNAAVALTAAQAAIYPHHLDSGAVEAALRGVRSPGRLDQIGPGLFVDAAHNPQGIEVLSAAVEELGWRDVTVVLGVMADKDVRGIVEALAQPWVGRLVCTQPPGDRALPAATLGDVAKVVLPATPMTVVPDVENAIAATSEDHDVLVTGSVVTAGVAASRFRTAGSATNQ